MTIIFPSRCEPTNGLSSDYRHNSAEVASDSALGNDPREEDGRPGAIEDELGLLLHPAGHEHHLTIAVAIERRQVAEELQLRKLGDVLADELAARAASLGAD